MKDQLRPPRIFLGFFRRFCDPTMQDFIEGDLMEVYGARLKKLGKRKADAYFILDVLLLFRPGIIAKINTSGKSNSYDMITSYFKTGWRNLWRGKIYSALNIVGLTFAIVCFLLISLYVFDELTFDRQHTRAERIYRVIEHRNVSGDATINAVAGYKLAEESKKVIPGVENTTRMVRQGRANLVDPEKPVPFQETVTVADENLLKIFDFPLLFGDHMTALKEPNSIVINEDLAMRIFNRTDVLGKSLEFSHRDVPLKITGILKNHLPNSSLTFSSLMSESTFYSMDFFKQNMQSDWASGSFTVYAQLDGHANADSVASRMTNLVLSNFSPEQGTTLRYTLQPLNDVHLKSEGIYDGARNGNVDPIPQGNPMYITLFSFVAVFVLLIGGINYTNLTTARASGRTKEIGVRKSIGAMQNNLITQFLSESLLTTFIAFIFGVIIVGILLPSFNQFANKQLYLSSVDLRFWLLSVLTVIVIGLLSGSYAALLLARLRPAHLLKGLKIQSAGALSVRKTLVVFQFTISIIMIIGTIVLFQQVSFLNSTNLGFNKHLMVVVDVNVGRARTNFEAVKNEMAKISAVNSVSVSSRVPGEWKSIRQVKVKTAGSTEEHRTSYVIGADRDFLSTFEIGLMSGRNFDTRSDSLSIIINETAAKVLNITDAAGQAVEIPEASRGDGFYAINDDNTPFMPRVIGIVKDFHFQSLRERIEPMILLYNENPIHGIDYYSARIAPTDIQETLDKLKAVMVANDSEDPFEYHFLDDQLALFYIEDERRQTLLGWVAGSTILIACLGLFGLATYSTEQRIKEIGVRKVMGATVFGLVSLLSRDFVRLVLVASAIAFPIAWWGTGRWLQEYAYHIDLSWWVFVLAAASATVIALLTVSYQAIRSALANPVQSLRSE